MALRLALLLFSSLAFSLNHVSVRNSTGCPAYYDHTTHWCASNEYGSRLCEIVDGINYFLCGNDTCYNHLQYRYLLRPLPRQTKANLSSPAAMASPSQNSTR